MDPEIQSQPPFIPDPSSTPTSCQMVKGHIWQIDAIKDSTWL